MSKGAETGTTSQRVVVIAIDGSENAKFAYNFYLKNIRKDSDNVYLLHSVEINSRLHATQWYSSPDSSDSDTLTRLWEEEKEKIKHNLEQFNALLIESGVNGTVKTVHAESPGEGICKAVDGIHASMVVMGTRGMGKIQQTFIGSVSDYVLHHCHVPVLICSQNNRNNTKTTTINTNRQ